MCVCYYFHGKFMHLCFCCACVQQPYIWQCVQWFTKVPSQHITWSHLNSLSKMAVGIALIALLSFCLMPCKFQSSQQVILIIHYIPYRYPWPDLQWNFRSDWWYFYKCFTGYLLHTMHSRWTVRNRCTVDCSNWYGSYWRNEWSICYFNAWCLGNHWCWCFLWSSGNTCQTSMRRWGWWHLPSW